MKRKIFLLIGLALLFVQCHNSKTPNGSASHITIATLKGPSSMGMIQMIDSLSRCENRTVDVLILNEPLQVRKMMIEGTADFAVLPTTLAAIMYNKGIDYQLVGVPVWGTLSLVGRDSTITSWKQLKGKRINVMEKGMTPDVLFRYLLIKNGVNPDVDVTLDYSFPTHIDLANAVAAGQAQMGVLSEPMASQVMLQVKSVHRIFDFNQEWAKLQGMPIALTAFLAKQSFAKENPSVVEQMSKSYKTSSEWVNQHPDSAAKLMVKYNILPNSNVALHAIPRSNLKFVRAKGIQKQIEEYLDVFYQMNPEIIGGKLPDENFYY